MTLGVFFAAKVYFLTMPLGKADPVPNLPCSQKTYGRFEECNLGKGIADSWVILGHVSHVVNCIVACHNCVSFSPNTAN
jgi:hypothetical protein